MPVASVGVRVDAERGLIVGQSEVHRSRRKVNDLLTSRLQKPRVEWSSGRARVRHFLWVLSRLTEPGCVHRIRRVHQRPLVEPGQPQWQAAVGQKVRYACESVVTVRSRSRFLTSLRSDSVCQRQEQPHAPQCPPRSSSGCARRSIERITTHEPSANSKRPSSASDEPKEGRSR